MKMETPKMDVVRFQEADVLAASPVVEHKYSKIVNQGTGSVGDMFINYFNGHSYNMTLSDLKAMDGAGNLKRDVTYNNGSSTVTLGQLVDSDDAAGIYSGFNGVYETNDKGATWFWAENMQQQ